MSVDRTMAGQFLEWRRNDDGKGRHYELLIDADVEPWGFDCKRFTFEDGSRLVFDTITGGWML